MKKAKISIIIFIFFYCLFVIPQSVSAEEARVRIAVDSENNGTLILVRVYQNGLLYLSYGYFTANHRDSNGIPFATVLIWEETRDIFMRFDERNVLISFSTINYDYNEEFRVYFCDEAEYARKRCDEMQTMWNGLYARYEIGRRVRRALRR